LGVVEGAQHAPRGCSRPLIPYTFQPGTPLA